MATYPTGEQKTIFSTTEPALVEGEMFELVEWANLQWIEKTIHPLIVLAVFVYEFLSIRPFQDGNERLGRLWQTLILSKWNELFAWLPVETVVYENQQKIIECKITFNSSDKIGYWEIDNQK